MSSDTNHNLELLASIEENTYLTCDENKINVDKSWMGMVSNSCSDEMYQIIETTLRNTIVYLELNIGNYLSLYDEYVNKINLLKKSLNALEILSENKGYEKLSNIKDNITKELDLIEMKLENIAKENNKRFYHRIYDFVHLTLESIVNGVYYLFRTFV